MGNGDYFNPRVKRPGREADHTYTPSAEVRMRGAIPPLPKYIFMTWYLINHRTHLHGVELS